MHPFPIGCLAPLSELLEHSRRDITFKITNGCMTTADRLVPVSMQDGINALDTMVEEGSDHPGLGEWMSAVRTTCLARGAPNEIEGKGDPACTEAKGFRRSAVELRPTGTLPVAKETTLRKRDLISSKAFPMVS